MPSRSIYNEVERGDQNLCSTVEFEFYEKSTVDDTNWAETVFDHLVEDILSIFYSAETIQGFHAIHYQDDLTHEDHHKTGDLGAHDVEEELVEAGWNDPDILSMGYVNEAFLWDELNDEYYWAQVEGGSAQAACYFDPNSDMVTSWKAQYPSSDHGYESDNIRWSAHGAAMELLHALIEADLISSSEHELGKLIQEYNTYYGLDGRFGSPIAAGPSTWDSGPCKNDDNPTESDRDGVTFTMTSCTRDAVGDSVYNYCK